MPVSWRDKVLIYYLLKDYTALLREALDIIVRSDARSMRRVHKLCCKYLRERYSHLHNKNVEETYKKAPLIYRNYVACLNFFSRFNDDWVAIRGGEIYMTLKAGLVVLANVASNDPVISERVLRGSPC